MVYLMVADVSMMIKPARDSVVQGIVALVKQIIQPERVISVVVMFGFNAVVLQSYVPSRAPGRGMLGVRGLDVIDLC